MSNKFKAVTLTLASVIIVLSGIYIYIYISDTAASDSRAVESWENTIEKLNLDMDIAFFGDSITMYSDFQKAFPDKKIINLGYGSEGLTSMCNRYTVISTVKPEKIFIMGGINYFVKIGYEDTYSYMLDLVGLIREDNPGSEIYVQSILPVTKEKSEDSGINNEDIAKCNRLLKEAADKNNYTFIDLFSLYEKNGYLNNDYTQDGIHVTDYSLWENKIKEYIYN